MVKVMIAVFARLLILIRRKRRASYLGFNFRRTRDYQVPKRISTSEVMCYECEDMRGLSHDFIDLFLDDVYGLCSIAFPIRTVLDVGGNVGLFAVIAKNNFPFATVHSYEPNPSPYRLLEKQARACGTYCFNEAVSAEAGHANVVQESGPLEARIFSCEDGSVIVTSIKEAVQRIGGVVDLLKLDCEGGEWDIFKKVDAFTNIRCIRMEYHLLGTHSIEELKAFADSAGFKITKLIPDSNGGHGMCFMDRKDLK
jgi:FkbM family methyltransferase